MKQSRVYVSLLIMVLCVGILSSSALAVSLIEGKWKECLAEDKARLLKNPDDIKTRFTLAVAYANIGELDAAMNELDALNKLDGGKLTRTVIQEYNLELSKTPDDLLILNYLAFAYFANNDYQHSKIIFEKILALDSESVWSLNYYSIVLGNLKEYDKALAALKRANSLQENKYTHFIYSLIYFQKGNVVKGMWHLSKSGNVGIKLLKK